MHLVAKLQVRLGQCPSAAASAQKYEALSLGEKPPVPRVVERDLVERERISQRNFIQIRKRSRAGARALE